MKSMSSAAQTRRHFIHWKRDGLLAPYVPEDVAKHFPPDQVDADGMYATAFAVLSPIGYNTNLVKPEDAPKSFADLLDPKWKGKIVKGRPDYSGTILTATFQIARDLGWSYFEKLAQQNITQVQSATRSAEEARARRERCTGRRRRFPTCCCSRSRVHQSKLSIRPRARR